MPFFLLPLSYAFCRWSYALTSCALDVHEVDGNDRHLTTIEGYYYRGQRHVMLQSAKLIFTEAGCDAERNAGKSSTEHVAGTRSIYISCFTELFPPN